MKKNNNCPSCKSKKKVLLKVLTDFKPEKAKFTEKGIVIPVKLEGIKLSACTNCGCIYFGEIKQKKRLRKKK